MQYYIIFENKIFIANNQEAFVNNGYSEEVHELPDDYNSEKYIVVDGELVLNPDYEKEQEEKEKERIANLNLTKADFWIALLDGGITKAMVKEKIELIPDEVLKAKTLIRLDEADHFWRGDPSMDIIGAMFGLSPDDLTYLFENKELPPKEETDA